MTPPIVGLTKDESTLPAPRVAVIGMGYVGAVSAASLAVQGCHVTGVEAHPAKLAALRDGRSPITEPGLPELIQLMTDAGRLKATDDLATAVGNSDIVMVCVGTPSDRKGNVNLDAIRRVTSEIAQAIRNHRQPPAVFIRSTVPPGTTQDVIRPLLRKANPRVVVAHHPEFLREGSALADWQCPPMIVFGSTEEDRVDAAAMISRLYDTIDSPHLALRLVESELMKYACNVFHAIKIDFANEIASVAAAYGADAHRVMDAFCRDDKLNISKAYLRPGFAFGGSCLPKDTRALSELGRDRNLALPLIESVLASNQSHLNRQVDRILRHGRKATLLLGLSFKSGTDDLRESPMVDLAERLLGKGIPLAIHDPDLVPEKLVGANAAYIREHLPHLHLLLKPQLAAAIADAQTVVIAKPIKSLDIAALAGKTVIDLTRGPEAESEFAAERLSQVA